jgi:hypothetical protein
LGTPGFGVSRIFKLVFAKNKKNLMESVAKILKYDFERLIINHGSILENGAKEKILESFSLRFPKYKYLLA